MEKTIEIPEGYEARIEGSKVILKLKESEDERIGKQLLNWFKDCHWDSIDDGALKRDDIIAWLEKQCEYLKFRDKIQIGDKVTRNPDGVLVNLSQLKRKAEQGSQKLANSAKTCKDEQKPAWSEEDERFYKVVLEILNSWSKGTIGGEIIPPNTDRYINWFKFLKERCAWKPSEEQINTLWDAIVYVEDCNSNFKGSGSVLENLYSDLKKLKG